MKETTYINICKELAKESKCISKQVGCIIVKDGRIVSTGINGTPSGFKNCNSLFTNEFNRDKHSAWSLKHEIHAEMNAILFAAKHGVSIGEGCEVYVTLQPCSNCLKHIAGLGIRKIVFAENYEKCDWTDDTLALIEAMKMDVRKLN